MQIVAEPASLLLARRDEPFAGLLEIAREVRSVHGGTGLRREVAEQPQIRLGQVVLACPRRHEQTAEGLAAVLERQRDRIGHRRPVHRHRARAARLVELDRGVRQSQGVRDRLDDAREGRARRRDVVLQALCEPRYDGVRIVALAVQETVHAALHADPHRLEQDRHDRRGDHGGSETALTREHGAGERKHPDVARDDARGQRAVQQRAPDDEVDLVQAVSEDRDAGRDGDRDEPEDRDEPGDVRRAPQSEQVAQDERGEGASDHHRNARAEPLELQPLVSARTAVAPRDRDRRQQDEHSATRVEGVRDGRREDADRVLEMPAPMIRSSPS